jgi:hypothetical protein
MGDIAKISFLSMGASRENDVTAISPVSSIPTLSPKAGLSIHHADADDSPEFDADADLTHTRIAMVF